MPKKCRDVRTTNRQNKPKERERGKKDKWSSGKSKNWSIWLQRRSHSSNKNKGERGGGRKGEEIASHSQRGGVYHMATNAKMTNLNLRKREVALRCIRVQHRGEAGVVRAAAIILLPKSYGRVTPKGGKRGFEDMYQVELKQGRCRNQLGSTSCRRRLPWKIRGLECRKKTVQQIGGNRRHSKHRDVKKQQGYV